MKKEIERAVINLVNKKAQPNKVILLVGARRVGKTRFIKKYIANFAATKVLKLNGEDLDDVELLARRSVANYKRLLKNIDLLAIDEAQHIPNIGFILKLIIDEINGIKIIVTGSSMFDLNNQLGEPLVGRKYTIFMYPLSQIEFSKYENYKITSEKLEERLLFGGYPELVHLDNWQEKEEYLYEIINDYLLKDILIFQNIKKADKIYNLLRLLAFQVGNEVSLSELGNQLQISKNTVESYLDLLAKVFVVFKVEGFSKNLRKEVTKSSKWYFYDVGIRNALIKNFNLLQNRNDVGQIWENYLIVERLKKQEYQRKVANNYFWRTYDQQELDWLEEKAEKLNAFEFKWNTYKKVKIPTAFNKAYTDASFDVITKENYLDFIL
ncbi:ATP-binding protein [Polaribacter batillariae]|uniref:ATP-binding protein n=1 Tax=Polaribacter batillariae TaxID=2808900 RepID=A0ABX7SW19_9FLAO|nr:ATP-binding protein [Polaribacter batillariae]QTD37500.1 ATP-binding protein [Polaribacter batillariae]